MSHLLSRFLLAAAFTVAAMPAVHAQREDRDRDRRPGWDRAHEVVNRAIEDLRHLERRDAFGGEDRDRYNHAMRALADFDRSISENRFDRGRLDEAIEQLDHVTRSRMLEARERDRVLDDLRDLRRLREEWRG